MKRLMTGLLFLGMLFCTQVAFCSLGSTSSKTPKTPKSLTGSFVSFIANCSFGSQGSWQEEIVKAVQGHNIFEKKYPESLVTSKLTRNLQGSLQTEEGENYVTIAKSFSVGSNVYQIFENDDASAEFDQAQPWKISMQIVQDDAGSFTIIIQRPEHPLFSQVSAFKKPCASMSCATAQEAKKAVLDIIDTWNPHRLPGE